MGTRTLVLILVLALSLPLLANARYARQVVDAQLVSLSDRDVLVLRGEDSLPEVNTYKRDHDRVTLTFPMRQVGVDYLDQSLLKPTGLVGGVEFIDDSGKGIKVEVEFNDAALLTPDCFRFSRPSQGILILEIFPRDDVKQGAGYLTNLDELVPPLVRNAGGVTPATTAASAPAVATPDFDPDALGIPVVDLRESDPQRVLGLAASTGLLDLEETVKVSTQNMGFLTIDPAGQSLVSWTRETPPTELYLSGTPSQVADFLKRADPEMVAALPSLEQFWAANKPDTRHSPTMGSRIGVDSRQRVKDDPLSGIYYNDTAPQSRILSDVRVTLPAMAGMNLYDVINYLSLVSGISVVIDPYTFDEPFGGTRPPLAPEPPQGADGGPGFRPAGIFEPTMSGSSGTVIGNFDNVPFDTALNLILSTHQLVYVVLESGETDSKGSRYGSPASTSPYQKPVILVTSRERMEQELSGQNEVDLWQNHYADPFQMTEILDQFGLTPSTVTGWFIYNGGQGSGYSPGGGGGGGGGRGGGGSPRRAPEPAIVVHRGESAHPVESLVTEELAGGTGMVRVLLPQSESGMKVTAISR